MSDHSCLLLAAQIPKNNSPLENSFTPSPSLPPTGIEPTEETQWDERKICAWKKSQQDREVLYAWGLESPDGQAKIGMTVSCFGTMSRHDLSFPFPSLFHYFPCAHPCKSDRERREVEEQRRREEFLNIFKLPSWERSEKKNKHRKPSFCPHPMNRRYFRLVLFAISVPQSIPLRQTNDRLDAQLKAVKNREKEKSIACKELSRYVWERTYSPISQPATTVLPFWQAGKTGETGS